MFSWKCAAKKAAVKLVAGGLALTAIVSPAFAVTGTGVTPPYFCQYVCPAPRSQSTKSYALLEKQPIPYLDGRLNTGINIPAVRFTAIPPYLFQPRFLFQSPAAVLILSHSQTKWEGVAKVRDFFRPFLAFRDSA